MLSDEQGKAFQAFNDSVISGGELDKKTTVLVSMAASMAIGCYP